MAATAPFILIAEDEPAHTEAIRRAFESAGATAEFQVVGTLREYRQAVATRPPDLALVDVNLPDGRAMEILTSPPDAGPFPVVVMTSYGNEWIAAEAMKAGALDYIPKSPDAFANMPHTVLRALDQWELLLRSKWAEQELCESEERFRLLVEQSGIGVGYYSLDGAILFFNRQALRDLGGKAEDYIGKSMLKVFGKPQAAEWVGRFPAVAASPHALVYEDHVSLPTGRKWFLSSYARMVNATGDVIGVQIVSQDITDRKWAEDEMRRSAKQWQAAFDGIADAVCLVDDNVEIIRCNATMARISGREASQCVGHTCCELIHGSKRPLDSCPLVRARQSRQRETQELNIADRWFEVTVDPLVKEDGSFGGAVHIAQDITVRKRMEETLRENKERFRTLLEAVTDYTYKVTVRDGGVLETVNGPGCLGVTGYSPEEFQADPDLWSRMVHPEDQPAVFDRAAKLSAGQKAPPLEHRIMRKCGEIRWVRNTPVPRYDNLGQYIGYDGLIQDITEYMRVQVQFAQAQKMEAIGQLAGGVAHNFRNQLTVIKGYGEMLLRRDLIKDGGREPIEHILRAADRSATISAQLLAFIRQQTLRPEVVNVNSLASDLIKSMAQILGEDIRLSIMPCGDLWSIRVDASQFQQALLNLVLNARDAMPKGGQLTIETANALLDEDFVRQHVGASTGRHVVLTVRDTGAGMDHETLRRLFEPFFTTKSVGKGTGLGLAMVHGFVTQSGGFVDVESQPGRDTTFRLYFPAVEEVPEPAGRTSQASDLLPRGSGTVLVVEDEEAIRRMLLETLGECGYTVLSAGNAHEAMALIESPREKIDLLIADVVMPGRSGPELAEHLQTARPDVPVLLISGHMGKTLAGHGVIPPDVNLLTKPFNSRTLAETVQKILGQPMRP